MKKLINIFQNILEAIIVGFVMFLITYVSFGQLLEVSGNSMFPNFKDRELILAEKLSIKLKPLKHGEVVIFKQAQNPDRLLIKRVIGLPGEKLRISGGSVFINDRVFPEPYLKPGTITTGKGVIQEETDYVVLQGTVVVMGDNRDSSTDSRDWGALKTSEIVGRGILVYYPIKDFRIIL